MNFKRSSDLEAFLRKPDPEVRAAVVYGSDRAKVRETAQSLLLVSTSQPNDPFTVSVLSEAQLENGGEAVERELCSLSMTGGRRVVWLRLNGEKPGSANIVSGLMSGHLDGSFNPDALFLVEAPALEASSGLRKSAEKSDKAIAVPCYEDERGDLARLAKETLARDKVGLSVAGMNAFLQRMPQDRGILRQELERLALWLGPGSGRIAEPDELDEVLGIEPHGTLGDASLAAFGGRMADAQRDLKRAFGSGETGVSALRALAGHLMRLRKIQSQVVHGKPLAEAIKAARVFWKQEREFQRQCQAWSDNRLMDIQAEIYEADRQCRTTGQPQQLLAERMLLSIAGKAKRLGL
jgi:DNA polymerase-3 subunit delta